jgi:hypothetical protein
VHVFFLSIATIKYLGENPDAGKSFSYQTTPLFLIASDFWVSKPFCQSYQLVWKMERH